MKNPAVRILTAVLAALMAAPLAAAAGEVEERSLIVDGQDQPYLLYRPDSYDGTTSVPLLVVHRGSNTPARAMFRVGFNEAADRDGWLVAYADLELVGSFSPGWVSFTTQLLDELEAALHVDSTAIYIAGFSRGSSVTHLLACTLSHRVAAVAAVDGAPLPVGGRTLDSRGQRHECTPERPMPLLHFHGTESGQSSYADARALVEFWSGLNGCAEDAQVRVYEAEGDRAIEESYRGCSEDAEIRLYSLQGAPHAWPGAPRGEEDLPIGANEEASASRAIAATPIIWQFFQEHRLRSGR